jgi:hypothetical protein
LTNVDNKRILKNTLSREAGAGLLRLCTQATVGDEMLTISDFILARVSEEEALAHAALDHLGSDFDWEAASVGKHYDRWNPWRVESTCIGRRLLVKAHRNAGPAVTQVPGMDHELHSATCATCGRSSEQPAPWPCYTLRVLALDWANHPDYRADWRPVSLTPEQRRDPDPGHQASHSLGPAEETISWIREYVDLPGGQASVW